MKEKRHLKIMVTTSSSFQHSLDDCVYKYFFSKSCMQATRASTASRVQAL